MVVVFFLKKDIIMHLWVKAHYVEPFWGTFGCSITILITLLFQKHGTFKFWVSILVFGPYNNFFIKLMSCNIILMIIIVIIYTEGSMSIFIVYIGIIGP
jgi:hypothetical protein